MATTTATTTLSSYFNGDLIFSILFWVVMIVLAAVLFELFRQTFLFYKQSLFKKSIEWTILEIKIPRDIQKTPLAMEQFLINLHGMRNSPNDVFEEYLEGQITLWWSLEVVSFSGKVHFYLRTPKRHKKLVEAAMYAQYPSVELVEIEDYLNKFPVETKDIYESNESIFGGELILDKDDFYPIKTYKAFELSKEELAIDPVSALIEVLGSLDKDENFFLQFLIEPASNDWKKEAESFLKKLIKGGGKIGGSGGGGESKGGRGFHDYLMEWSRNIAMAPAHYPKWKDAPDKAGKEGKKEEKKTEELPKEKTEPIKDKILSPGFNVLVRFIYLAPNSAFNIGVGLRGIRSALNQYTTHETNAFKQNINVWPLLKWHKFPYFFLDNRIEARKQRLWHNFRERVLPEKIPFGKFFTSSIFNFNNKSKTFILNTVELATIFHIPSEKVLTSPHIETLSSKRMGPPAGLPIFEEE
ncbi:hypothetical protein HZC33_00190 [Candidatus Wolfebacteria bacterium]|nr:hypothetical protein [Candidatus Wolfebacteria bacterium]